jgi:SPX domain protein involved in polyphosphate accumulation
MTTSPVPAQHSREVMNRFEVKYLVATTLVPELLAEFREYTEPDPHSRDANGYRIFSIYWDTAAWTFFWEKIEGVKFRRKLRFRRYGDSPDIFIEVKQREDRTVQKRRIPWTVDRVDAVFGDGTQPIDWTALEGDSVATEAALMIERLRLRPRMGVLYRRRALFGAFDPELRITVDSRIQYRPAPVDLAAPFDTGHYALDPRVSVLEIKYDHRAPTWLTKAVARHGFKIVRMSKYCSAVDRHYFGGQNT